MATLELSIDEDVAVSPVKRTRRLGPLFWAAIAWIILIFAAAGLVVIEPCADASGHHDHGERDEQGGAPLPGFHCVLHGDSFPRPPFHYKFPGDSLP